MKMISKKLETFSIAVDKQLQKLIKWGIYCCSLIVTDMIVCNVVTSHVFESL